MIRQLLNCWCSSIKAGNLSFGPLTNEREILLIKINLGHYISIPTSQFLRVEDSMPRWVV